MPDDASLVKNRIYKRPVRSITIKTMRMIPPIPEEIGQGEHGLRLCQILGQAAIAHLGEAPLRRNRGLFSWLASPRPQPIAWSPNRQLIRVDQVFEEAYPARKNNKPRNQIVR